MYQEVGVYGPSPFPVELLELFSDLHGNVAACLPTTAPVVGTRIVERDVERLELVYRLIELAAEGVEGLVMLDFGTSDLGQEFRLLLL